MDDRELLPGEYAALGLLALDPAHGYELHRRWQASPLAEVLPVEQSVLYGYLRTLDRRGLLDWEEHRVGNRPVRKIYEPNEAGWELLRAWLRAPVHRLRDVRLDLLLKLYVLDTLDPRAERALLDRQVEICERLAEEARAALSDVSDGVTSEFTGLFQQSRVSAAEAALLWLRGYRDRHQRKARVS
ncbi:MAG: PadR family transcriptional regulator [Dehalococcoidia bacterium]|nr:PadR family transcriptional regulator [Dehalococcoidia bacterium]